MNNNPLNDLYHDAIIEKWLVKLIRCACTLDSRITARNLRSDELFRPRENPIFFSIDSNINKSELRSVRYNDIGYFYYLVDVCRCMNVTIVYNMMFLVYLF